MEILKNPNFDFLGKARYFVGASLLLILAGVAYMLADTCGHSQATASSSPAARSSS